MCGNELSLSEFNKNRAKADGLQTNCRSCTRRRYKTYYERPVERERLRSRNTRAREAAREYIRSAKNMPCTDCGKRYPHYVMDFDHLDPSIKRYDVARMASSTLSIPAIQAEIDKCELVCSNCHRERTFQRGLLLG